MSNTIEQLFTLVTDIQKLLEGISLLEEVFYRHDKVLPDELRWRLQDYFGIDQSE